MNSSASAFASRQLGTIVSLSPSGRILSRIPSYAPSPSRLRSHQLWIPRPLASIPIDSTVVPSTMPENWEHQLLGYLRRETSESGAVPFAVLAARLRCSKRALFPALLRLASTKQIVLLWNDPRFKYNLSVHILRKDF